MKDIIDFKPVVSNTDIHNITKEYMTGKKSIMESLERDLAKQCKDKSINLDKVFRLFYYLLYKATEQGLNDTLVKVSKDEYLMLFNSFDKQEILYNLDLLTGLKIHVKNYKREGFINIFKSMLHQEQERGYIKAKFTEEFLNELKEQKKKNFKYFLFNKNLFSINIKKNPHCFMLGIRIFYNKRINLKQKRENEITIKSLLDYCFINYNSKKYQDKQLSACIKTPIERDLNKLQELNIIRWSYKGEKPTTFDEFLQATITYKIPGYDELKEIQKLKEKKVKK